MLDREVVDEFAWVLEFALLGQNAKEAPVDGGQQAGLVARGEELAAGLPDSVAPQPVGHRGIGYWSDKFLENAQKVGMVFLLALMVFIADTEGEPDGNEVVSSGSSAPNSVTFTPSARQASAVSPRPRSSNHR